MALARACMTDSVYIARNRSIKTPVSMCTEGRRAEKEALLDFGATESFIHPRLVKELKSHYVNYAKYEKCGMLTEPQIG